MNKQELASLIWDYCNGLRGSISTVEYKDFILGFIFYRFLSEKEIDHLKKQRWTDHDIQESLNEEDQETVVDCKENLGYFIAYTDLFSTWKNKSSFDIASVSEAINRFERNIDSRFLNIFEGIFKSLSDKLPKLGTGNDAKSHIKKILNVVAQIPMDGKQGYDVLGFIYEYLLANFASNAGKKDGEFYTPHEISVLMSDIVANHLKDRETIAIFDPTSGSGSLLINIGQSVQKYLNSKDNILYYAQEKIDDTYNLTRMNLVMRGVNPSNIKVRCNDTLKDDWPYIDYNNCYTYVPVDCVVSNPPYSQKWDAEDNKNDPRYKHYGIAPAAKADYAFLLHDLYHLKDDGIMCIVLPHGVLFRGGSEKDIRQNLIEENNIETIIGLPANIFYGTGIPTIIMVLKKHRTNTDVLFIDASKEFYKDGSKNKLGGQNIKKITDAVIARESIPYFAKKVEKSEIIANDYNLNIPRYISSTKEELPYDINCTMLGNIPNYEIEDFKDNWKVFPTLKGELFEEINAHKSKIIVESLKDAINANQEVKEFIADYKERFAGLDDELFELFLNKAAKNIYQLKNDVTNLLFGKCENMALIDKYDVYKAFDEVWAKISIDLEMINTRGDISICREIEDIEVYDKKSKETITKGQQGKILPFALIKKELYYDDYVALEEASKSLEGLQSEYNSMLEELDPEAMTDILKNKEKDEDEDQIDNKKLKEKYNKIIDSLSSDETIALTEYTKLSDKEKLIYEKEHSNLSWPDASSKNKKGVYTTKVVMDKVKSLKAEIAINEDEDDYKFKELYLLSIKISSLSKKIKDKNKELDAKVIDDIVSLSDETVYKLLKEKWVTPIVDDIHNLSTTLINNFVSNLNKVIKKYANPLKEVDSDIDKTEKSLLSMLGDLNGDEFDMEGLMELRDLLGGEPNE